MTGTHTAAFHNAHNFVNNLAHFYAQIVLNCEARRLKQFVGSAYKKYKIFYYKCTLQYSRRGRRGTAELSASNG